MNAGKGGRGRYRNTCGTAYTVEAAKARQGAAARSREAPSGMHVAETDEREMLVNARISGHSRHPVERDLPAHPAGPAHVAEVEARDTP